MRGFWQHSSRGGWAVLLSVAACFASGGALAQVTNYVVVNPIDVCLATTSNGTTTKSCAPFGMSCSTNSNGSPSCTTYNDPVKATASSQAIATTPIGFVDGPSNTNTTRAIWLQTGIDVVFLPVQEYDSSANTDPWLAIPYSTLGQSYGPSDYRSLHVMNVTCSGVNKLTSPDFEALTQVSFCKPNGTPQTVPGGIVSDPPLPPPGVPLAANLSNLTLSNALNMFFVNNIVDLRTPTPTQVQGFSWINGNGIAIAGSSVFTSPPRFDTLAHEIGHALNLDHATLGAGTTCTGKSYPFGSNSNNGCNLMDAGSFRTVPQNSSCTPDSSSSPGGELYDLDTALCGTSVPKVAQADQLLLGTSTNTQQGMALASGFMVPIANVPSTATAGGGTAVAATTAGATTITAAASANSAINFNVTFPSFVKSGGRSADQFIVALIMALPEGFQYGTPAFFNRGGGAMVFGTPQVLNGNNGQGNTSCLKPINGAPAIQCLEILFTVNEDFLTNPPTFTGSFTTNTSFSFSSVIINKSTGLPATLTDLVAQCTLATESGPPFPLQCLDLTYVFSDLFATTSFFGLSSKTGSLMANSQLPDPSVASAVVDKSGFPNLPADYPSFIGTLQANGQPLSCTLTGNNTSCPPGKLPEGE